MYVLSNQPLLLAVQSFSATAFFEDDLSRTDHGSSQPFRCAFRPTQFVSKEYLKHERMHADSQQHV